MYRKLMYLVIFILLGLAPMNLVYGSVPDLIAWWTCDEGAGNTVADASGNGHDGAFVYGDPAWTAGVRGSAVELYGPTLVEVPAINMTLTEATMAGWIKPDGSQPEWASFIMTRGTATGFNVLGYQLAYHWNDTSDSWSYRGGDMIASDDWTFAAVTIEPDRATFYVNGVAGSVNEITHASNNWNANIYLGGDGTDEWVARRMNGALDDVAMFSRALTAEEILVIMDGLGAYPKASGPTPANGAMHMDTWVTLSWKAGDFAVSHDVYMGENFDEVNDASTDSDVFRGNQATEFYIAGFPGFAYPEGLVPGSTYYWRIDEVNAPPDETVYKGDVWSFSVPPKKAYAPNPADGAVDVALNAQLRWTAGFGAKLHTVYFGEDYDTVANAIGGAPAGTTSYNPGPLKEAKVYYWRVDEFDAVMTYKGDVWSFTTTGAISNPNPADGAVNVTQTPILTWDPAIPAASHEIYFGTDAEAVRNATSASPEYKGTKALGDEMYEPGQLAWNTSYYWRIDEVNNTNPNSPWLGRVWSFTTADFVIVEDFESYTDDDIAGEAIWQHWVDGYGVADNGAQVGYLMPPYAEQATVNNGLQSMPLLYSNLAGVTNSEAVLTLSSARDWTQEGVADLSLWVHGAPASTGSFVEGPTGTYTMTAEGTDIWGTADQFHYAYKTLTGAGSMQAQILSVENTNAWAKAGVMIRETLDPGSKYAWVFISPSNGCRFQARATTDGDATSDDSVVSTAQTAITAPYWVKFERDGANNFRGYYSANGTTWQPMTWNAQNISMAQTVYIGLGLTSHSAGVVCEAKFSDITSSGGVSGQWTHLDIGIASNAAEPMYVSVSNASGAPAVVAHDDPAVTQIDDWSEWRIPLQAFADQGINLGNVDKIAIGLGTQSGLTGPGGSGTVFIDDIRLYKP
ncbi:MAG: hypothetical protein JXM79_13695 [Sedimentisphaerales bacterium]|nr:hypothetical protein [Sedimentisphaerales bacterium]